MARGADTSSRPGRAWLYAPFVLLLVLAAAWTGAWFVIRDRTLAGLDAFFANEAQQGRRWTCADRRAGGYPFRVEVACASLAVERSDLRASLGRVLALAQVYQPRHIIFEAAGPAQVTGESGLSVDATWRSLRGSLRAAQGGLQRLSLVAEGPAVRASLPGLPAYAPAAERLEAHLRPHPTRAEGDGALEASLRLAQARLPFLDELLGGAEPAELALDATGTQLREALARPVPEELERWRQAGGRLELAPLVLTKGPRRVEARGALGLDEQRRVSGRLDLQAQGVEGLLGVVAGSRLGGGVAGDLLGGLLGGARPRPQQQPPGLTALPPVRLENGRVYVGPIQIPGVRLTPLY